MKSLASEDLEVGLADNLHPVQHLCHTGKEAPILEYFTTFRGTNDAGRARCYCATVLVAKTLWIPIVQLSSRLSQLTVLNRGLDLGSLSPLVYLWFHVDLFASYSKEHAHEVYWWWFEAHSRVGWKHEHPLTPFLVHLWLSMIQIITVINLKVQHKLRSKALKKNNCISAGKKDTWRSPWWQ